VVVLPTPPFWFAIAMTCATRESPLHVSRPRISWRGADHECYPTIAGPRARVVHTSAEIFTIVWITALLLAS